MNLAELEKKHHELTNYLAEKRHAAVAARSLVRRLEKKCGGNRAVRRRSHLKLQFRNWVEAHHLRAVLFVVLPFAGFVLGGTLAFVIADSLAWAVCVACLLSASGLGILFTLLVYPSTNSLTSKVRELDREFPAISHQCEEARKTLELEESRLSKARSLHESLAQQLRRQRMAVSFRYQSQSLVEANWRAMRSIEFEDFVERVFRHLGYETQQTPVSGDQGVDLVVVGNGMRLAVQVKGYFNSVSNSAVQQAVAGRMHYGCSGCAVVTNSRFTQSAQELAASTGCLLIDEFSMRDFIYGRVLPPVAVQAQVVPEAG